MKKLLYIEDDISLFDVIKDIVGDMVEVTCAPDLYYAEKNIQENSFDFIISDVELPDGNALEFFSELKEQKVSVPPLVFLTGHDNKDFRIKGYSLGAEDYLVKPVNPQALVARLKILMNQG